MARTAKGKTISYIPQEKQPFFLPNNWCWVSFGCINQYTSVSIDPAKQPETIFELYSVPSSADNYPEIVSGKEIGSTKQAVEKGDVLLCKINPRINRVWKVSQHTNSILLASSEWIIIRNRLINSDYLMYCFRSPYFRDYMLSNVSGVGGSLMRAQPKYVKEYPVPIPPLAEQQRIVDRIESLFAKLDEAKEKAQAVVDGFENRKTAILSKAFMGELTSFSDADPVDTVLPTIKQWAEAFPTRDKKALDSEQAKATMVKMSDGRCWIKCSVGAIGRVSNGSTPSRNCPEYWKGSIPWVSSGEVRNIVISSTSETITQQGFDNSSVKLLPRGTVLIAMIGEGKTRGQSAILGINATINQNIAAVIIDHGLVLPEFLWYWFQMNYTKNREKGAGSGPQALNCQRVRKLEFVCPSLHEQKRIVDILRSLIKKEEQIKELSEQVIDQIDTMKKSILARAFSGKLGTNDPTDESAEELLKRML